MHVPTTYNRNVIKTQGFFINLVIELALVGNIDRLNTRILSNLHSVNISNTYELDRVTHIRISRKKYGIIRNTKYDSRLTPLSYQPQES